VSSNPELSTEDLAGTGAGRATQYGETADRSPDAPSSMTGAGLDENRSAAGQGRTDAAVGGLPADEGAAGYGGAGVATGGPMGTADMEQPGATRMTERTGGSLDTGTAAGPGDIALLDASEEQGFRQRWSDTQARFVDDPQGAVQTADALVAELMQSLARGFSEHKGRLESHWQSGGTPDTEDLRQALQRYRSFFDRLLST